MNTNTATSASKSATTDTAAPSDWVNLAVDIDTDLLAKCQKFADKQGIPLNEWVAKAIRNNLDEVVIVAPICLK